MLVSLEFFLLFLRLLIIYSQGLQSRRQYCPRDTHEVRRSRQRRRGHVYPRRLRQKANCRSPPRQTSEVLSAYQRR